MLLDPPQLPYRQGRSPDNAFGSIAHLILKHLESPKAYAHILFIDFSSAFNMLEPPLFLQKLSLFLSLLSNYKSISTSVPQDCVTSPLLFLL